MYTSVVGKKFVSQYNQRNNTDLSAQEYFEEKLFPLFFDHAKYLQSSTNTPLFQVIAQKKTGDKSARKEALLQLGQKISFYATSDEKIPDMSFAVGYGSADADGTTSGQITTLQIPLEEEDFYASWIGAACGIGIAGGFNLLTENPKLLALVEEGWELYRKYVEQTDGIENKVETWNGVWLAHRLSSDFDPKKPTANFNPVSITKKNEVKMERPAWSKLFFLFSRQLPTDALPVYVYSLGQTNKTIGFFSVKLPEVKRLSDMYVLLYGKVSGMSNRELASVYETAYGFSLACERFSVIGLRALEPKDLRKYMRTRKKGESTPIKWNSKNELTYFIYITWIVAMLNRKELASLAEETAQMLISYSEGGKKGLTRRSQDITDLLAPGNNDNAVISKLTVIMKAEPPLTPTIEKVVNAVLTDIPKDNLSLFLTLIDFYYSKKWPSLQLNNKRRNLMNGSFIYLRGLRHAEHTVFCVADGQKKFYDSQFNRYVPYSSGQQVKRSALDAALAQLGEKQAPITFNKEIKDNGGLGEGEPWSPCDPDFTDQLLGGWMRAQKGEIPVKRRSPLSISAMRALHPLLSGVSDENLTFDRSSNPDIHPVKVRDAKGKELTTEEIAAYLEDKKLSLTRRNFIQGNSRANGLFVYDTAIDLRTLFTVSLNKFEREITDDTEKKLRDKGWKETKNAFGSCLVCPEEKRNQIINALAHGLLNWRITTNQSRTFSLMETLAFAITDNANVAASAIRAKLVSDSEKPKAMPVIDQNTGADVFVTLPCEGYIPNITGHSDALNEAEKKLIELLKAYDYENQV